MTNQILEKILIFRALFEVLSRDLSLIKKKLETGEPLSQEDYESFTNIYGFSTLFGDISDHFRNHPDLEEEYRRRITNGLEKDKYRDISRLKQEIESLFSQRTISMYSIFTAEKKKNGGLQ